MSAQLALYGAQGALQLAGGYFAAQNVRETARINQEIAEMNAEFAELDAQEAFLQGETQKARYQSVVDDTLSKQRLALTAQNVDTGFGTAASIAEETKFTSDLNKMEIEKRAQEAALGYKNQAREFRMSGAMGVSQGEQRASQIQFQSVLQGAESGVTGYVRSR